MKKRLLITGFDPFDGGSVNPSSQAVMCLPDSVADFVLCKLMIPTVFEKAALQVLAQAEEFHPDVILCVGLAGGRDAVTPERIAVNIRDARIPDNEGNQPAGAFVSPDGPAAYFATVPLEKMARSIRELQIPATVSNTAGTYVCNDVFYTLLHHFAGSNTKVGFIHVPKTPELGEPSLPLASIIAALNAAIAACQ